MPKAADSTMERLLVDQIAVPQHIAYVKGNVEEYPFVPAGTLFLGLQPIVTSDSPRKEQRDWVEGQASGKPFYVSAIRDPLARVASLYDYKALFNMSDCDTTPVGADGYHYRTSVDGTGTLEPFVSHEDCLLMARLQKDEADAQRLGVAPSGLLDHFWRKRHPLVRKLVLKEAQHHSMIPSSDASTIPTTSEVALGCAMANIMKVDMLIDIDRFDQTVLPTLKYHAPHMWAFEQNVSAVAEHLRNLQGSTGNSTLRPPQVLSPDTVEEIRRLPIMMHELRFYNFASKIARARERNMFACLEERMNIEHLKILASGEIPDHNGECRDTCGGDIITQDEWMMMNHADCRAAP
jgi:hypothetical protein